LPVLKLLFFLAILLKLSKNWRGWSQSKREQELLLNWSLAHADTRDLIIRMSR
jgi:hypothetical protein